MIVREVVIIVTVAELADQPRGIGGRAGLITVLRGDVVAGNGVTVRRQPVQPVIGICGGGVWCGKRQGTVLLLIFQAKTRNRPLSLQGRR